MPYRTYLLCGLTALGFMAKSAQAETTWTLGVIATHEDGPYVGSGNEVEALPYLSFESGALELSLHDGLTYRLIEGESYLGDGFTLSARLAPRFGPVFTDDAIFDDLDRDTAVELGFAARYSSAGFYAELEALRDVSDTHDGTEATASVGYDLEVGPLGFDFEAGAIYRSAELNQHLFGVGADEVTATRAAFDAPETTRAFASITALYPLSERAALVGRVRYEDYGALIDSPLVDQKDATEISLGVLFQF